MPYARPKPPAGGIEPNYPGVDSGTSTETEADHFGDYPVRGGPPPPHGRKYIKRGSASNQMERPMKTNLLLIVVCGYRVLYCAIAAACRLCCR
jgi:hypothetical protein